MEEGKENRRGDCQSHPRKHLTGFQVVILSDTSVQEGSSYKTCAAPLQRAAHALSSSSLSDWSVQSIWRSDRKKADKVSYVKSCQLIRNGVREYDGREDS